MTPTRYLTRVLAMVFAALFGLALLNAIIDPLRIYREPHLTSSHYYTNARLMNAGVIRQFLTHGGAHDAVVIGSSLAKNIDTTTLRSTLGAKGVLQLSMDGAYPFEQYQVLRHALGTGEVMHVVWFMDSFTEHPEPDAVHYAGFPDYLYNRTLLDDYKYLLSARIAVLSLELLTGAIVPLRWADTPEAAHHWWNARRRTFYDFSKPTNIAALQVQAKPNIPSMHDRTALSQLPDYDTDLLRRYLSPLVAAHPQVTFYFVWPPTLTAVYYIQGPEYLQSQLAQQQAMLSLFGDKKNVQLVSFINAFEFTNSIGYYGDLMHFDLRVSDYLAHALMNPRHQLSTKSWPAYQRSIINSVSRYQCC